MRPNFSLRAAGFGAAGVGALMFTIPVAAAALGVPNSSIPLGATAPVSPIQVDVTPHQLPFGRNITVTGTASFDSDQVVALSFSAAGSRAAWRTLATTKVSADGRFQLRAPLRESGVLQVIAAQPTTVQPTVLGGTPSSSTVPALAPSPEWHVSVAAALQLHSQTFNDLAGGQPVNIRGRLLPGLPGRRVRLQASGPSGWTTVASTRTGARGAFDLQYAPSGLGQQQLRVRFAGDRHNTWIGEHVGTVTMFQPSVASWYYDGGNTACGFHAYFGVANKSLPCGTQVTFHYGGSTVTATVDDRGPFVAGRTWDLNQNTAAALGFSGVDTVWVTN